MAGFRDKFKSYFYMLNTGDIWFKKRTDSPVVVKKSRSKSVIINIILFILTLFTTTLVGAHTGNTDFEILLSGLPYSITLLSILLTHEFGHYFAARRFGVEVSLPYFIPFPSIIGTMGAIIKIKSPIPDRKALFYIGVMGPLPGFILSLAAVIVGIYLSEVQPLPISNGVIPIPIFGDSLLFAFVVKLIHGNIPQGHDIYLSSYAWAGWIGFLVTSLNLMPIGQLDGSHILYALIGRKQIYFGWAAFLGLFILSFFFYGWILWIILTLLLLMIAHPPVQKTHELTVNEKIIGWVCMVIFIVTFIPVPIRFI